jgi:hypothetical protein
VANLDPEGMTSDGFADAIGAEGRFGWFWTTTACSNVLCDRFPVNIQLPSNSPLRPALGV